MALFGLNPKSKFITTEPLGKSGERGESKVWEAVKLAFTDRNCIAYWRYPIFSRVGKTRKEPDILIADVELGLIVIEVKSMTIDQIVAINGHRWEFRNFYTTYGRPYQQAENQLFALLGYCDREPTLRCKVTGRAIVSLPLITQTQWQKKGFDQLPSCPPILFQDHLLQRGKGAGRGESRGARRRESRGDIIATSVNTLIQEIEKATAAIKGKKLDEEQWKLILAVLGGSPVFRKPRLTSPPTPLLQGEGSAFDLTSPPTPLLQGEGSNNSSPPFPCREGGMGGVRSKHPWWCPTTSAKLVIRIRLAARTHR